MKRILYLMRKIIHCFIMVKNKPLVLSILLGKQRQFYHKNLQMMKFRKILLQIIIHYIKQN